MNMAALEDMLAEGALLSTFPFIFYWFIRPLPPPSVGVDIGALKVLIAGACALSYLLVCGMYALFWFGSGMSGGGAGPYPLQRLMQYPLEVALRILALSALSVGLGVAMKGTLGLWVFAIGAGFTAYWAGLGWLPVEMDSRFVWSAATGAGVCGAGAGFLLSRGGQWQSRVGKLLIWSVVGAGSAATGMLAAEPAVQRTIRVSPAAYPPPVELTPFSVDPWVMLPLLATAVVVWLSLSTIAAYATGYIKPSRGAPAQRDPE
jgi:hypothetical protein